MVDDAILMMSRAHFFALRTAPLSVGMVFVLFAVALPAQARCKPVTPIACPECFAVAVLPDTQRYTWLSKQPQGAAHLDLITRYLCNNATRWTEPSSGKQMPIKMVLHLGDMVQSGDMTEAVAGPLAEWRRIDAAFDRLDACDPVIPYLVTTGNHDYHNSSYEGRTVGYETYFGSDRWTGAGYGCDAPRDCSGKPGDWFIGGGDPVLKNSRNNVANGGGLPGPALDQAGRHRAGIIRAPNNQRFLFVGLELAFDFPPAAKGHELTEGDDSAWVKNVLANYPGVPTVVFHHSMFWFNMPNPFGPEVFRSDSLTAAPPFDTGIGIQGIWNEVVDPYAQIFMAFAGHVINPAGQNDMMIPRKGKPGVAGFVRNYQMVSIPGVAGSDYGAGWTVMAVFDPQDAQIRVRSYRVDDTDAYAEPPIDHDHNGMPAPTECMETDYQGVAERALRFDFATDAS